MAAQKKGPARIAVLPSRGSTISQEDKVNVASNTTAAAAASKTEPMNAITALANLEGALHDAVNMSDIAADLIDAGHHRTKDGNFLISDGEMRLLAFSILHTCALIGRVKNTWDTTWDEAKGGAE